MSANVSEDSMTPRPAHRREVVVEEEQGNTGGLQSRMDEYSEIRIANEMGHRLDRSPLSRY